MRWGQKQVELVGFHADIVKKKYRGEVRNADRNLFWARPFSNGNCVLESTEEFALMRKCHFPVE